MHKLIRIVGTYAALSLVVGLIGLAAAYPEIPSTPRAWVALFALALPVLLAAEVLGHFLWNNRAARFVDDSTRGKSLSLARIAYGVLAILLLIGLGFVAILGWRMVRLSIGN